ncbi:hypothetical protein Tco_1186887 [Tanacetum coccineum]
MDVQATNIVLQEMFLDEAAHHISSPPAIQNTFLSKIPNQVVHAKVLTEMKKLLPTHVPKVLANYVKPRLNNSVLEVAQNNQIKALDAQEAKPSFHKRTHDHQDTPTNHKGDKRKKRQKDVGWFTKKSGSTNAMKRTTWFDFLLKLNIDQNENHILRPSIMAIEKKLKELIQKDEITIADHEGDVSKPRLFESHMSKSTKPHLSFYNNNFYYLVSLSTGEKYATSLTNHFAARYYIQGIEDMISERWSKEGYGFLSSIVVRKSDKKEYTFSYADLHRLNLNDIEDMYLLKVQDKLHHLELEFEKKTLTMHFFSSSEEQLKGRDWNEKDIKRSKEMLDKIDQVMKHREQLRYLEEYVGGRPKTIHPRVFVRPV